MRVGGAGIAYHGDPEAYAREHVAFGYRAAYMPKVSIENRDEVRAIAKALADADVTLAEAGAWRNLIAHDEKRRKANLDYAIHQLALADEMGARACVAYHGTVGHPGDPWQLSDNYDYGPHPDNQSEAGFQRAVDTVRYIIDAVKPRRTKFSLEMVPWLVTDTPENDLKLLKAIDRTAFGAHVDAVNMVVSPRHFVMQGGPGNISFHMDEVVPGDGNLDDAAYLAEIDRLGRDVPLMLEHFDVPGYRRGLAHIRRVAAEIGVEA